MADPLYYGTIQLNTDEIPKLTSGEDIVNKLKSLSDDGKKITDQLYGKQEVLSLFEKLFPEVVESNDICKVHSEQGKAMWTKDGNTVEIEIDNEPDSKEMSEKKNLYIGGPAALFAAFIEAKSRQQETETSSSNQPELAYLHNGSRGLSNWKGSASYFHVRDSVPVFYWPDNTGTFVFLNTLKHGLQKKLTPNYYYKEVFENPDFNMLRLSYKGVWNELDTIPLFVKNTYHMLRDVGLYLTPTSRLLPPFNTTTKESIAYVTLQHAAMSRVIFDHYSESMSKPMLLNSSEMTRALHLELTPGEKGKHSFIALKRYNKDYVPFRELSEEERKSRGYSDAVLQALEFPVDGYLPPYLAEILEEDVNKANGSVSGKKKLTKILVHPKNGNDLSVSRVVVQDTETGSEEHLAINELFISLGPSARKLIVNKPNYSLWQHAKDVITGYTINDYYTNINSKVYPPTMKSLLRHAINEMEDLFASRNILPKMMWASGSTSVLLIKVDPEKVGKDKLGKFRDHLDKHNRHFVRLGEKRVVSEDGKEHIFFATQVVGGGAFPSLTVHPETALNAIKGNAVAIYGLENDGVEYDIVQVRSCARGVTGQNAFRFTAPFANMVQIYGVGGIGMTTMAPNGLLMKALMKTRQLFAAGFISEADYFHRLKSGDFGDIPHYDLYKNGLQRGNFLPFIPILKSRCDVVCLDSNIDYRRLDLSALGKVFLDSTDPWMEQKLQSIVSKLIKEQEKDGHEMKARSLTVFGREIYLPVTCGKVAVSTFNDLCMAARGAADYLEIAKVFDTVVIQGIPRMTLQRKVEARRFITMIDNFYDNKVRIVCTMAETPERLFVASPLTARDEEDRRMLMDDLGISANDSNAEASIFTAEEEIFAFERTISRLTEMQTDQYWNSREEQS